MTNQQHQKQCNEHATLATQMKNAKNKTRNNTKGTQMNKTRNNTKGNTNEQNQEVT